MAKVLQSLITVVDQSVSDHLIPLPSISTSVKLVNFFFNMVILLVVLFCKIFSYNRVGGGDNNSPLSGGT